MGLTRVRVCITALEEKVLIFSTAPVCCTRMRQTIEVKRIMLPIIQVWLGISRQLLIQEPDGEQAVRRRLRRHFKEVLYHVFRFRLREVGQSRG